MKSGKIEEFQKKINSQKDVSAEGLNKLVEWIIKTFKVTDIEAKYMLNIDLKKCAIGYLPIYERDSKELEKNYNEYFIKMNDDNIIKQEILQDLEYFKKKYGPSNPRICRVIKDTKDDIPSGTFQIVITENNFVKKIAENDPINTYRNDVPKFVLKVDNAENIILFDKLGKAFKLPVHKVAMCDKNSQGFDLRLILKNCTSEIVGCIYEPFVKELSKNVDKCFMVVLTRNNCIKKMDLDDFTTVTPSGLVYTKLADGDFVQSIDIIDSRLDIIIYSDKKAISYNMSEVPHYKRNAMGAAAMNSKEPIDGMSIIYPNATDCVVITEQGKANKFNLIGLKKSTRNKSGNSVIKLGKTDNIVAIYGTNDNNILSVITKAGVADIPVKDIPASSSAGAGVKLPVKAQVVKVQIR